LTPEDVQYSIKRCVLFVPAYGPIWMLVERLFGYGTLEDFSQAKLGDAWNDMVNENRSLIKEDDG
ncbi:MAG: ABC transporter substrate-binding protein, partial [Atribacterota bacterium]